MPLPSIPLQRDTITVSDGNGGSVNIEVRGLSRGEVIKAGAAGRENPAEGECQMIALACDMSIDGVRSWYETAPYGIVQTITEKINALSGLDGLGNASSED